MKVQVIRSRFVPGRVLIGPKVVGGGYYRIVSQHDHSGRIEAFDPQSRCWSPAPEGVTFDEIWRAPSAPQWCMDLASAPPSDTQDEEEWADEAGEGRPRLQGGPESPGAAFAFEAP